jgi:hypothetical protein
VLKIQENQEITLLIPEKIVNNKNISNYGLATYCILHVMSIPFNFKTICVTRQQIIFYLTGNMQQRRLIHDYIKSGLAELIDQNVINKIEESEKHFLLDCSSLWINTQTEKFIKITFNEVQKIFSIPHINNFLLLRYFITLMGTITSKLTVYYDGQYKNRVIGNYTIEKLSQISGLAERSIIEYNKKLEENELIYIYRQEEFIVDKENNIKRLANVYGRFCDSKYVDEFANNQPKYLATYQYLKNNVEKANDKRKYAQMYRQLLKDETKIYPKEEIINVYNYVLSENQKFERMYEKDGDEEYLDKIRDLDVFLRFDFMKEILNQK